LFSERIASKLGFPDRQNGGILVDDLMAQRAAETLLGEHKKNTPFKPFASLWGLTNISDAYDVQNQLVSHLSREHGHLVGYKIGLTSAPMQNFCGIDHPISGVILSKRVHQSGFCARSSDYGRLGLEFEIAVRIGADIPSAPLPYTAETIKPFVESVCAGIELVDDRGVDYATLEVLSLLADNSWNAGIVLSEFTTKWPDLESVAGKASKNSVEIGEGHGRDVLGHPFNSVAWLANQLASRNQYLKAGQIIMTGSLMKTVFPTDDATYRFDLEGIGSVSVQVMGHVQS
jgi:2-keto-4-pentenoate hydratase